MVLAEDLRQAVLQAALQGKLTEQLETDSDVDDLLERIQKRKEILIEAKEIKKSKTDLSVDEDDFLFQIPSNWRWVKLGRIATVKGGKRVPVGETLVEVDTGHKYIRVADMKNGTVDESDIKYITNEVYSVIKNYFITKNDIYITVAGTIGRVGSIPDALDMANLTENADKIIFEYLNKEWLINVLNSKILQWQIVQATKKVGQPKLALNKIETLLIPIPPIEEQQRIVNRINELMNKIDEYEKNEKELETLKKEFPTNMKDALLQAAMQGKLTEQLKSDSSVDELMALIQKEKKQLVEEKKIYKDKKLVEDVENKFYIDIPNNWRFVNLQEICTQITDGEHKTPNRVSEYQGYYLLSARNILNGKLVLDDVDYVSKEEYDVISKRCNPHRNDILISCSGSVGRCCLISDDNKYVMVRSAAMIRCLHMNNKYIMYAIQSPYIQTQIDGLKKQSVQANLFQSAIASLLIPIPPIEEQQRIVERLDKLLPLCDDLKEE